MGVSVEVIAGLCHSQQPVDGFQSPVGLAILIMNAEGRRMSDENIQGTAIVHPVQHQTGKHPKRPQIGFSLSVLVGAVGPVTDRAAQASDQKFVEACHLQIQVDTALHIRQLILRTIIGIVISGHIQQGEVQNGQQIFEIGIRQVAAAQDQLHIIKMAATAKAVESLDNLIAHRKNFHSDVLCRRNRFPTRESSACLQNVAKAQFGSIP